MLVNKKVKKGASEELTPNLRQLLMHQLALTLINYRNYMRQYLNNSNYF